MKTTKKSMIEDKESLEAQVQEINEFLAKDTPESMTDHQRGLLVNQVAVMGQLINILAERIASF